MLLLKKMSGAKCIMFDILMQYLILNTSSNQNSNQQLGI